MFFIIAQYIYIAKNEIAMELKRSLKTDSFITGEIEILYWYFNKKVTYFISRNWRPF